MSSQLNIYIDKGADFRLTIELFDEDDTDYPVSSFNFYGDIKKMYSSKPAGAFEFTQVGNNDIAFSLDADITSQLKPGKYQYDILKKNIGTGDISKVVEGLAFVVSTVTEV